MIIVLDVRWGQEKLFEEKIVDEKSRDTLPLHPPTLNPRYESSGTGAYYCMKNEAVYSFCSNFWKWISALCAAMC
jgi:hypothetical protein